MGYSSVEREVENGGRLGLEELDRNERTTKVFITNSFERQLMQFNE